MGTRTLPNQLFLHLNNHTVEENCRERRLRSEPTVSVWRCYADQHGLSGTMVNGVHIDTMVPVDSIQIRPAHLSDLDQLALLCEALWPKSSAEEHAQELRLILGGKAALVLTLPLIIFVAEANDGTLVGFLEVDLRSHADGCNPSRPVGYIEGWYVTEDHRQCGVGRKLDNELSQRAHEALGYEVVDRCVHYRKRL